MNEALVLWISCTINTTPIAVGNIPKKEIAIKLFRDTLKFKISHCQTKKGIKEIFPIIIKPELLTTEDK